MRLDSVEVCTTKREGEYHKERGDPMSFFITGGEGQLGHELIRVLSQRGVPIYAPSRQTLDITKRVQVEEAFKFFLSLPNPQGVIHSAALTNVDTCGLNPKKAYAINTHGSSLIAQKAAESHLPLVYISTDYVFDGLKGEPYNEEDRPQPINIYGRSKLEGERETLFFHEEALIIRTSWLFGLYGYNFIEAILHRARQGLSLEVVEDEVGCPTWTRDLAHMILDLLDIRVQPGIYHLANRGIVSRYALAKEALGFIGWSREIEPILSSRLKRPARRPLYSALNLKKAREYVEIRDFRRGLSDYIEELKRKRRL